MRSFIKQFGYGMLYLIKCLLNPNFHKFRLKDSHLGEKAYILANGPSLKKTLEDYDAGIIPIDSNTFMVNHGALDEKHFMAIRPKHYCFDDPIFYRDYTPKLEATKKLYSIFQNKVDWEMNIYICFTKEEEFKALVDYSKITNPHIHFIKINKKFCAELKSLRCKLWDTGYFMPDTGTIANTAIYVALLEGYKEIELFGVDHSQFLDLAVNDHNQLCSVDRHFYDVNNEPKLKPFIDTSGDEEIPFRVSKFFAFLYAQFYSHELLREFADYKGAKVLNCTPHSYTDAYERKLY